MKPGITFSLICLFLFSSFLDAQSCLPDGIVFSSQEEIDSFPTDYPDCTAIAGTVRIDPSEGNSITNLDGLQQLTSVGSSFYILNSNLENLAGLNNLNSVGFILRIQENPNLVNVMGLENLTSIGYNLEIKENPLLENIAHLENLTIIEGGIEVVDNNSLTDLSGLNQVTSVGATIRITDNASLTDIQGLENIDPFSILSNSVPSFGDLIIRDNPQLSICNWENICNLMMIPNRVITISNNGLGCSAVDDLVCTEPDNEECIPYGLILNTQEEVDNFTINYPNCSEIFGTLCVGGCSDLPNTEITNLNGLSQITNIHGDLILSNNDSLINFTGLDNLVAIGGGLRITNNDNLQTFDGLNQLTSIGQHLEVFGNYKILNLSGLESLTTIGAEFSISGNEMMVNFSGLESLTSIGSYFEIDYSTALQDFSGLESLVSIQGYFWVTGNPVLVDLTGLNSLNFIGGIVDISDNDDLISLAGLNALSHIGSSLVIGSNGDLENLDGLASLSTIDGNFYIGGSGQLTNLSGLENLTAIGGRLSIFNNASLTSLSGLHNIDPATIRSSSSLAIADLLIKENHLLSECEVESICRALSRPDIDADIANNAVGCNSAAEIACLSYRISGHVFYDQNQNGIQDATEAGIPNIALQYTPQQQSVLSDQNGYFYQIGETGVSYTIAWLENPEWSLTTTPTSYTVDFEPSAAANMDNNFGLIPLFSRHEATVNLSSNPTRCNTEADFFLRMQNTGTFTEDGYVTVSYDPLVGFVAASPAPAQVDEQDHLITWNYQDLPAFQYLDYSVTFSMPDETNTGEVIYFNTEVYRDSMGQSIILDTYDYTPEVLCSYDPNDKLVMPAGEQADNFTLHDEKLTYTIRFQNTGNAAAIDIRILDTIDMNLDLSTFQVLNSSFPPQVNIQDRAIEFYFKDIWLPDSLSSEAASHGFVTYEISPLPNLSDFTVLENTAYIIFDFNPPIITNTSRNTMVSMLPTGSREPRINPIKVYPNPSSHTVWIVTPDEKEVVSSSLYDFAGRLIGTYEANEIDLSKFAKGFYFLQIELAGEVYLKKIVIQ